MINRSKSAINQTANLRINTLNQQQNLGKTDNHFTIGLRRKEVSASPNNYNQNNRGQTYQGNDLVNDTLMSPQCLSPTSPNGIIHFEDQDNINRPE